MANIDIKKIYEWPTIAQVIFMAVIGLLVFYIGYIYDIAALRREIQAAKTNELQLKESYKAKVKEHVSSLHAVLKVPKLKLILLEWQKKIIKADQISTLQDKIIQLAQANQLKTIYFNPAEDKKEGNYLLLPIKVQVNGTFDQIARYMSQIANLEYLVVIQNVEIVSMNIQGMGQPKPINSDNAVDAYLNLEIYKLS